MFGIGKPRRSSALEELKQRLTLPDVKQAENVVVSFYQGRNPYEHLKSEWPAPYAEFVKGFAYALERCKKEGMTDFARCEVVASSAGVSLARAAVAEKNRAWA